MSKKKKPSQQGTAKAKPTPPTEAEKAERKKVAKHSTFLFWFTLIALLVIFAGRWLWAITDTYYSCFVERGSSVEEAVANMNGLTFSQEEEETLLPLQQAWDLFTSSRLRDEVTVTADDGVTLHGYLYNEGSDITVVVLPRFDQDGTADFLPGVWLNEQTGCNLLLPDPRNHGESGGDYYGYGYLEQYDLDNWLDWAEETLGAQTFILWGEGSGANTILFAQQSGLLDSRVAFAVAESPIASLHEMAQRQIFKWYTVPAFPFLSSIEWKLARSEAGYTIQDLELADLLADGQGTIPVLFLESSQDEYILPEWSTTVYLSYNGEKELIYGGGTHGTVYAYRQDEIQSLLSSWCSLYVK